MLRRNWILITACTVFGVLAAGVFSLSVTPTYTAQTRLFAATQNSGSVAELQQGNSFTQARVQSYAETAGTPVVLQPVIEALGLEMTPAELAPNIEASTDVDTVLLTITASDPSPVQAAAIAQAVADSLVETIENLETTSEDGVSPVKLSVVTPATAPTSPSAPNTRLNLALGLVVGLMMGLAAALLRTTLDTRLRGEADLRKLTEAPILGGIAFDTDATKKPLLTQAPAQSPRAESFRQIRTNLQFSHVSHHSKTVLVTSSLPGEGKSTTAVNLAIAMAQSGQSVVLIDADLRRPRVDEYLGLERNAGLTTALIGRADVKDLLQPWGEDELYVLTSGQIPPNPSELLGSKAMKALIAGLEEAFDAVIIDAPPLLPVTDAAVLAQQVGGVVMVIGSSKVKLPDVQKSLASLEMVDADLLGVVLNLLPTKGPDSYAYSYYSYEASPAVSDKERGNRPRPKGRTRIDSDFDEKVLRVRPNQS
ncbi:polysaccharide biosynthesis tyrosine autokinase [Arthrobacter sp. D2-10]